MPIVEGAERGCCLGRNAAVTAFVGPVVVMSAYVHDMLVDFSLHMATATQVCLFGITTQGSSCVIASVGWYVCLTGWTCFVCIQRSFVMFVRRSCAYLLMCLPVSVCTETFRMELLQLGAVLLYCPD